MAIAIDTETFYSKKLKCSVKILIAEQYCNHPAFDCYMVSVSDGKSAWSGHPKYFNWSALEGQELISHNSAFDKTVIEWMQRTGKAPKFSYKNWFCSANMTSYLCNRRALDNAIEHLFEVKLDKSARANAEGKRWPDDFSPAERVKMLEYAKQDATWTWRIWDKFSHKWPELERRLSDLTIEQGRRGVQINVDLLNQYIMQVHEMKLNTEKLIPWLKDPDDEDWDWDGFNLKPTSTKCIAEQCRRNGIPCCPVKSEDEEAYLDWENLYGPTHRWIYAVGQWRSINKLYQTFLVMKSRIRLDGSMPFGLKYFGGHTGRWSGDARVNMQNQRKRPILCNEHGLMETNDKRIDAAMKEKSESGQWPDWVRHEVDFRALLIPRPGKKMICSDLSQIEPRVLAYLSGNKALLSLIREGYSVYEAFARTAFGYAGPKWDKQYKKSLEYNLVKVQVLGLGYGCGWEKFISQALDYGLDITKDDPEFVEIPDPFGGKSKTVPGYGWTSKQIVKNFREKSPLTTAMWEQLDNGFKRSVGEDFVMRLPNGREMRYGKVKASTKYEKDPVTGLPKRKTEFSADTGGRRFNNYGGKLTENLVQAVSRDIFAEQVIRMQDRNMPSLFTVHDENVVECDQSVTAADVEAEMRYCPEWIQGLPLDAEASEVAHYQK